MSGLPDGSTAERHRDLGGRALLSVITRVIGRRELGEMEPFDLILLVELGDLIGRA